jgi:serine protease Do
VAGTLGCVLHTVGFVRVTENDGNESSGSGFVVTSDGKFLTCFHVIENAKEIYVRFDQDSDSWFVASFIDGDQESDLAVLKLEGDGFPYALLAEKDQNVPIAENVDLLGYPLGDELGKRVTFTAGVVSSLREKAGGVNLIQIDAGAYHGSSGGPLFRESDGKVIGILSGGLNSKGAAMLNFAISIQEFYDRLTSYDLKMY